MGANADRDRPVRRDRLDRGAPRDARARARAALASLCTAGVGVFYPILLPAAGSLALGGPLQRALARRRVGAAFLARPLALELCGLALAALVAFAHLRFVTASRAEGGLVELSSATWILRKCAVLAVVTSPLSLGALWARRARLALDGDVARGLAWPLAALAAMFCALHLPHIANEYKFMFAIALALAPFAGAGFARALARAGRGAVPALLACALVAAWPLPYRTYKSRQRQGPLPALEVRGTQLALAAGEPWSALCAAARDATPADCVLVVDEADRHVASFAERALWAPARQAADRVHAGFWLPSEHVLANVRGYGAALVEGRAADRDALFGVAGEPGDGDNLRRAAFERMRALGRPLAIATEDSAHAGLASFLRERGATRVAAQAGRTLWLVPAAPAESP